MDMVDGSKSDTFVVMEDKQEKQVLVLGVGNYLMGDEGIGVHIAHRLDKIELPAGVDALDGGTGGFFLMSLFDEYPAIIFVDATMDGQPAGTISQIKPRFAADFPQALSVHDVGLKDMIEAVYLLGKVPDMHIVTISVKELMPMTMELSQAVEESIPEAIDVILKLARKLGISSK